MQWFPARRHRFNLKESWAGSLSDSVGGPRSLKLLFPNKDGENMGMILCSGIIILFSLGKKFFLLYLLPIIHLLSSTEIFIGHLSYTYQLLTNENVPLY